MINENEPAGVLVKTTLIDFPGLVASSFFLPGCNLSCPYCYNIELAKGFLPAEAVSLVQLYSHLEKRKNVIQGLCISGGEPLLNPKFPSIITKAKSLGYKIKIDTNGTQPEKLKKIMETPSLRPDFIAMDIKTLPQDYSKFLKTSKIQSPVNYTNAIKESIRLISFFPKAQREFRTVLVPPLVNKENIRELSQLLPEDASWQFSSFINENCLDEKYNSILPYTDKETEEIINLAKERIPDTHLR